MLEWYVKENNLEVSHSQLSQGAEKTRLKYLPWTLKYRSRAQGQIAGLKGISRTFTLQSVTCALSQVQR